MLIVYTPVSDIDHVLLYLMLIMYSCNVLDVTGCLSNAHVCEDIFIEVIWAGSYTHILLQKPVCSLVIFIIVNTYTTIF